MMRKSIAVLAGGLACLALVATAARAAETPAAKPAAKAAAPAAANPAGDAKVAYLAVFDQVAGKLKSLAAAIPEDKYGWSPAKGVRTVGEVLNHVSGTEYLFVGQAGLALPVDAPKDPEKGPAATAKKDILGELDKAIAFARKAAVDVTPEQLAKAVDFYGTKTTARGLFLEMYGHMSEHLGQLIAYARSVGVVPPWSK